MPGLGALGRVNAWLARSPRFEPQQKRGKGGEKEARMGRERGGKNAKHTLLFLYVEYHLNGEAGCVKLRPKFIYERNETAAHIAARHGRG